MKIRKVIKTFSDGREIGYGTGKFDDWCVFIRNGKSTIAPLDKVYFSHLLKYARKVGREKVYNDLKTIFHMVDYFPTDKCLNKISGIASSYGDDSLEVDVDYTTIYMGMISEEHKANAILGKRMKMLGIHQTLFEEDLASTTALTESEVSNGIEKSAKRASELSKNVKWKILDDLCKSYGF